MLIIALVSSNPTHANAGFFDNVSSFIFGTSTQASEPSSIDSGAGNSQTIQIAENTSTNPDVIENTKNSNNTTAVIDGDALSPDVMQKQESDTNAYASSSDKIVTYTVKSGDTVGGVASQFNISNNTILYSNTDIKNNTLTIGQTLMILPVDGVPYTVKSGDSISSIAKAYKADANDITQYNNISNSDLKIGDKIIVPGGTVVKKVVTAPVAVEKPKVTTKATTTQEKAENSAPINGGSNITTGKGIADGYIWPLPKGVGRVSQKIHADNAYDIAAPKGTPIYAIADGTVLLAHSTGYNGGYGLYVVVNFDDGAQAIFGHMSKVASSPGETVKQGDIIGYVGSTGESTGNHIHIGYRGGKPNPYRNLPMNSNGL